MGLGPSISNVLFVFQLGAWVQHAVQVNPTAAAAFWRASQVSLIRQSSGEAVLLCRPWCGGAGSGVLPAALVPEVLPGAGWSEATHCAALLRGIFLLFRFFLN